MTPSPFAMLGGTFDPVHYGHLRFADEVRRSLGLAQLHLVPAGDPRTVPSGRVGGRPPSNAASRGRRVSQGLVVDSREVDRAGKSYTVLTLEALRREDAQRPLLLLVGADAFRGLPSWHRWRELFALGHLVVVARPGVSLGADLPAPLAAERAARLALDPAVLFSTPAGAIYEDACRRSPSGDHDPRATRPRSRRRGGSVPIAPARGFDLY